MIADLIDLDDRAFADLVAEARASIPSLTPAWTDHNESDPGIALVELFAWLTEIVCYRLNQVSDNSYWAFLKLLNAPDWQPGAEDLATAIRQTVALLRDRNRAITPDDYQYLILEKWPLSPEAAHAAPPLGDADALARVRVLPGIARTLDGAAPDVAAPADVSVVLLSRAGGALPSGSGVWDPVSGLGAFLDPRRLLTTHVHLCNPRTLGVTVRATLYVQPDADVTDLQTQVIAGLAAFVHPFTGGRDGKGWPFGQGLYASDVYALLQQFAGVDFVDPLTLTASDPAAQLASGVSLATAELIAVTAQLTFMIPEGSSYSQVQP